VVTTSSDPHLGAIRLAWWRERLEELDEDKSAPPEPRLQAIEGELLPRGVSGAELSKLEDAWLPLLEPFPWDEPQAVALRLRARILFGIGARLLGSAPQEAEAAGALWSLVDGAQHCSDASSRATLLSAAKAVELPRKIRRVLRPLTVLAALAVAAVTRPGSGIARGLAALGHRVTGRFPPLG
jgi:phytoene synthase